MKTFTMLATILLTTNILLGQYNTIDTSFYSEALQETKMVDIYFPPGYDDHPDWNYPVIYYLHAWNADQNTLIEMINPAEYLINNSTIDPVIMVSADNSPVPFNGSMYVNSDLWGNYEDYMIDDLINWIDNNFRTIPEKGARALLGQSMGAYGAFRYGIVHKDKFTVLAAHAGIVTFNKDLWMEPCRQMVILENQPGPTYTYNSASGPFTAGTFILSGAFSPNLNSPQTYIEPQVVEFLFDENAGYIDSILVKWQPFDLTQQIKQLSPEDSVGIYFGCGTNDNFLLYPANQALNDTLDALGLPHEFYTHTGSHNMPTGFKHGALIFIDSLLMTPGPYTNIHPISKGENLSVLKNYPNPFYNSTTIQFELSEYSFIELDIWNNHGQQVGLLFAGNKNAGIHQVVFDASTLPRGVYFCTLQVGSEVVVKKIIKN
jgi:S-formylglutathione hydrolase FrmB